MTNWKAVTIAMGLALGWLPDALVAAPHAVIETAATPTSRILGRSN